MRLFLRGQGSAPPRLTMTAILAGCALLACGGVSAETTPTSSESTADTTEPFTYDPAGHRDPFVALVRDGRLVGSVTQTGRVAGDRPVLYGILWDPGGRSIALINDVELKVGDTVAGYQVAEIQRDAVVLTNGGEPLVLTISFDEPVTPLAGDTPRGGKKP